MDDLSKALIGYGLAQDIGSKIRQRDRAGEERHEEMLEALKASQAGQSVQSQNVHEGEIRQNRLRAVNGQELVAKCGSCKKQMRFLPEDTQKTAHCVSCNEPILLRHFEDVKADKIAERRAKREEAKRTPQAAEIIKSPTGTGLARSTALKHSEKLLRTANQDAPPNLFLISVLIVGVVLIGLAMGWVMFGDK